jgi:carbon-monoxide dehydrogenase medium subunit
VYPHPFRYYRPGSLNEAAAILTELGEDAKPLAGGQSLIPLMKLRLSAPSALVDLNFIPNISSVERRNGTLHLGAMARHSDIEYSDAASAIPIIHDCAAGIADPQVRNRGTIGGSLAEADPNGDWGTVLLTLDTHVHTEGPDGHRTLPLSEFFLDAYTTQLRSAELINDITVKVPAARSSGAYMGFKRCASVYSSAGVAVQLTLDGTGDENTCADARIVLGCVGLTAIRATKAEAELRGKPITPQNIDRAAESGMNECDPQPDMRGSAEYKRVLIRALVKRTAHAALRRARGEKVEVSHEYAAR